jgi:UDPglucose--hexose-1-phosphate uridylyltransferase
LVVDQRPEYDPKCYLCPGNTRVGGKQNPAYTSTFNFENDFPAVQATINFSTEPEDFKRDELLFRAQATRGECHVICFSPNHKLTVAQMQVNEILPVIDAWSAIYKAFCEVDYIDYCQIFENKGEMMGCSNPHPHGQVWGTEQVPEEPRKEIEGFRRYQMDKRDLKCCLLCDYVQKECDLKERIVVENDEFVCVVPWWAVVNFSCCVKLFSGRLKP